MDNGADDYVRIQGVSRVFRSAHGSVEALANVSTSFEEGSFVSLVGPSGCGKSTLLQIIAGLDSPSEGTVCIGKNVVDRPARDAIYVFQQYSRSLYPWKTVAGNVRFGLQERGEIDRRELDRRADDIIRLVKLHGTESLYPWQLSGGMQQRVAIARALICRPRLLLMDEPFGAVDALTRSELQDLLLEIWRRFHLTVIFVTHDIEEAIYLSDRVVMLGPSPGHIIDDRRTDLERPRHQISTRESKSFLRLRHELLRLLFSQQEVGWRKS
jgi:NitT/TauT family transport system ATP-binding protein